MATARQLLNATTEITISTSGTVSASQQNLAHLADNSTVQFTNDAPFTVELKFSAEFGNVVIARGSSSSELSASEVTVTYTIYNAVTNQPTGGPYSIQWGNGPLAINISGVTPTPPSASVAVGGTIQFSSDSDDGIGWTYTNSGSSANVWSPQPGSVTSGQNGKQTALPGVAGNFTYSLSSTPGSVGKGTIKIG
jgi:hypothetical protein